MQDTRGPAPGIISLMRRIWARQNDANAGLLAAGIAFYALLSLFPAITAGAALAGMALSPSVLAENSQTLTKVLPEEVGSILLGELSEVLAADSTTLGIAAFATLGLALYSASKATGQAMTGLNAVLGLEESRGFAVVTALKLGLTLFAIILLIVAVTVTGALPAIARWSGSSLFEQVTELARWPVLLVTGAFGISVLYRYGPDRPAVGRPWITKGAIAACALWFSASVGFTIYAESFGSYNQVFGALGGVIILLTWLWLSAFSMLLGAAADAELAKSRA
ncbi:YihY/virulence factor BrkB family protein [Leisingera thetidis]|uniref:YihY/virulence factor BrkB family protein n=1 Tax=Leisingera thetidis TaxID=2930199 RepID=UPI0021F6DA2D|nr:YihY/virulence factor BrkB family protein [Leisingera thetidis]